jgi:hypothetical protein
MGERRELNPRMVDSQSTALIHLATSAPTTTNIFFFLIHLKKEYSIFNEKKKEIHNGKYFIRLLIFNIFLS